MFGRVLPSGDFGTFLEMSEVDLESEFSLRAGVSVTISQFGVDLSKLVTVFKDAMFMFFFAVYRLTGISTFITEMDFLLKLI